MAEAFPSKNDFKLMQRWLRQTARAAAHRLRNLSTRSLRAQVRMDLKEAFDCEKRLAPSRLDRLDVREKLKLVREVHELQRRLRFWELDELLPFDEEWVQWLQDKWRLTSLRPVQLGFRPYEPVKISSLEWEVLYWKAAVILELILPKIDRIEKKYEECREKAAQSMRADDAERSVEDPEMDLALPPKPKKLVKKKADDSSNWPSGSS